MRHDTTRGRAALRGLWLIPALLLVNPAHGAGALFAQEREALPMWEVTGGERPLYVLGSIHLLRPEVYPLDDALYEAFDAASVVAFELDLGDMMRAAPMMMQRGMLRDGRTLRDVIGEKLYAELERRVEPLPVQAEMFSGMKPWFAAITLSAMVLQQAGFQAETGLDMHFHRRAMEADKRILGLETMEDQIAVFDELGDDAQAALMRQTLEELDESAARLDEATALWQRGDAQRLADMFLDSMRGQEELMDRLVYQRNRDWIPGIEALLRDGEPAIVIVGMGHLIGDGSVIELLRERGWEVRRVTTAETCAVCAR